MGPIDGPQVVRPIAWPDDRSSSPRASVSELLLQAPNRTLELANLSGRRQIQSARHAFQALIEPLLDPTTEAEPLHQRLLRPWVSEQLGDARILKQPKEPILEIAHRVARWDLADDRLQLGREERVADQFDFTVHEELHRRAGLFGERLPILGGHLDGALGVA